MSVYLILGLSTYRISFNNKLSAASIMQFSSWKENPIDTHTRMIVGVIPSTLSAKIQVEMTDTHINHLMHGNTKKISIGNIHIVWSLKL